MRAFDLHAHTVVSDGTLTPTELVEAAARAGLAGIAVTDHDHVGGIDEAREAGRRLGVEVVAGIELSLTHAVGDVHLLGYLFDPEDAVLLARLQELRAARERRAAGIVEKLARLGIAISMEDVAREASGSGRSIGRPHVARVLVSHGHARDIQDAFDKWLGEGRPAFVPKLKLTAREGIHLLRRAGGVASLAHAGLLPAEARAPLVRELAHLGMRAVEVDHPKNDAATRAELRSLASELGLVETGGSDFHGDNKPGQALGCERVPADVVARLNAAR